MEVAISQRRPPIAKSAAVSPRRILLVGNFLSTKGGNRGVCEELADHLAADGWSVITTSSRQNRVARLADMVATIWRRRRHYDIAQVDVFSGSAFLWAEAACTVLKLAGKPFVLTLHGGNLPEFARRRSRRVARLLQSAAAVTTPSRYLLECLQSCCDGLRLLPNPLDLKMYEFKPRIRPRPRLVWMRAFAETYNPVMAIHVLHEVRQSEPHATLLMIGPDKGDGSRQEVESRARTLGVIDAVTFTGGIPKSKVPSHINEADIFLNTTNVDNTPISVLEALASGLCVVTTNVGGIPYLLTHDRDALLTEPNDFKQMAAAVHRILEEPGLAERLSLCGRKTAEQFDWSSTLPQWNDLLMEFGY
jgi:glycosyltransferase involved in cell wall biosynthesis